MVDFANVTSDIYVLQGDIDFASANGYISNEFEVNVLGYVRRGLGKLTAVSNIGERVLCLDGLVVVTEVQEKCILWFRVLCVQSCCKHYLRNSGMSPIRI